MALPPSPIFSVLLLFLLLCAHDSMIRGDGNQGFSVLRLESLKPANVCVTSKEQALPSSNSLKVVHRHGPCSASGDSQPDHLQILSRDSFRVAYLQNRIRRANAPGNTSVDNLGQGSVTLRAQSGSVIGSDSYVVTVGIGNPKTDQTVIFDTGSNICWVQCKPCRSCYQQREPMFDPSASSSFRTVPFTAPPCTTLPPRDRSMSGNNSCVYRVRYGDSSSSTGILATERLTLTNTAVLSNFVLGCGQSNTGFRGATGLFGLGRGYHSLVSQAPSNQGKVFSYCLPASSSISGHLTIGRRTVQSPSYTPMLHRSDSPNEYFIDLVGITVGTQRLRVSPSVFQSVGTIIDSGTAISRLPPAAYVELRNAFRSGMTQYRHVQPFGVMDTCYDFSHVRNSPVFPPITLHFAGPFHSDVNLVLKAAQVFFLVTTSQVCLGFAQTDENGEAGIIGTVQQRGIDVVYDLGAQKIGFAAGNCG